MTQRRREIPDDGRLVAGDVARVGVIQHDGVAGAQQLAARMTATVGPPPQA